jgi:hypothetical protein
MAKGKRPRLPAGVKRLRDQIERWRRTRERRTAMPAELWSEAVALAGSVGAYPVARTLRLNFDGLKRRMAEAGAGAPPPLGFVELTGAQILGAGSTAGTIVEMSDAAGIRVRVHLGPETQVDVAGLILALRQRRDA